MVWKYNYKKSYIKYGHKFPDCVEARNNFSGNAPGESSNAYPHRNYADVLIVAYKGGGTTVSMNGTAPMGPADILGMAEAAALAEIYVERGFVEGS